MYLSLEGDVFDDTAISEELLDDNDDVLNVRYISYGITHILVLTNHNNSIAFVFFVGR